MRNSPSADHCHRPATYEGRACLETSSSYFYSCNQSHASVKYEHGLKSAVLTLSSSASAHRSLASLNTRTTPSLLPLTISPLGIAETAHTEMAGCTMTCAHSPSGKVNNQREYAMRLYYTRLSICAHFGPHRWIRCRHSAIMLESTQTMCVQINCV